MFGDLLQLSKTRYQYTEFINEPLYKMLTRLLEWCDEYQESLENLVTDSESSFWAVDMRTFERRSPTTRRHRAQTIRNTESA